MQNSSLPPFNFNLNSCQRDATGLVANVGEAREIIRNLQSIIQLLMYAPFETLSLATQTELSLYLVGTHILTRPALSDTDNMGRMALLETLFNEELDTVLRRGKAGLDAGEILQSVERLFRDFGG